MTTIKDLILFLAEFRSNDMPIKILSPTGEIIDFNLEDTMISSPTAHINRDAPEEEWDTEDGKTELGDGEQYLLLNPTII